MSYFRETSFTSNNILYAPFLDSNGAADGGADKGDDREDKREDGAVLRDGLTSFIY